MRKKCKRVQLDLGKSCKIIHIWLKEYEEILDGKIYRKSYFQHMRPPQVTAVPVLELMVRPQCLVGRSSNKNQTKGLLDIKSCFFSFDLLWRLYPFFDFLTHF